MNWEQYLRVEHPDFAGHLRRVRVGARRRSTRSTRSSSPRGSRGSRRAVLAGIAEDVAGCGGTLAAHNWRSAGSGQPRRLAGRALPLVPERADRLRSGRRGRHVGQRVGQVGPAAPASSPPHVKRWNELVVAARVPALLFRDELSPAALPERRAGQARRLLHARLQPDVDEPGRVHLARGAAGRVEDRSPRGAHPDLERDRVVGGLRAPDGARLRAARPDEPGDARRPAGSHSASRCGASRSSGWARRSAAPTRRTRARSGRRPSSGSTSPGEIDPTARSASASTSSRRTGPASAITMDEYFGWMFENSVPGLPEAAAKEGLDAARLHAQVRRVRDPDGRRAGVRARPSLRTKWPTARIDEKTRHRLHERGSLAPRRGTSFRPRRRSRRISAVPIGRDGRRRPRSSVSRRPSRKLEFYSPTLAEFGWPELAIAGVRAQPRPSGFRIDRAANEFVLLSTYRLPTLIHTRSANAKWLVEISHSNPTWIHPSDAARLGRRERRPRAGRHGDRPLRATRSGSRRASVPASSRARTTSAAGGWPKATA